MRKIIACANKDNYTFFFPIWLPIFFSFLIALTRTPSPMLNRNSESEHACLLPYLGSESALESNKIGGD